jgi:hypothetical protein
MDTSKTDLLEIIYDAWQTCVKPLIDKDPDELARRLARRRSKLMQRPPRAWCLAVRASDRRINPATAIIVPEDAAYPPSTRGYELEVYREHEVTLDARLLRQLVRPIFIPKPGIEQAELARMMGCSYSNLRAAIRCGAFRVHHVRGLGGKWGPPVPVLYTDRPIDPSRQLWNHADPLWGTTWKYLCDRVPDDLCQTITRVPLVIDKGDGPRTTRRHRPEGPQFAGWQWICPGCRKTCRTILYPLPPVYGIKLLDRDLHPRDANDPDALPEPMRTFACAPCHNVLHFARLNRFNWNHLISHLSGGMMYGREVPRPTWYVQRRTRPFRPNPSYPPSRHRPQILEAIVNGLSHSQTALKLGVCRRTVTYHAKALYRQHGVKGLAALRAKLGGENAKARETADKAASSCAPQSAAACADAA